MNNKDIVSLVITWIRVPLMILVIFVHSSYECYPQYNENAPLWSGSGIFTFIGNCVSVFAHCGVPCFFVISGYLFFRNISKFDWRQFNDKYRKRVRTLLIPYIFWNTIVFFWNVAISYIHGVHVPISIGIIYDVFVAGENTGTPAYLIMWYIRDLMVMSLLSPLILILFRYTRWLVVVVLFLAYVLFDYHISWLGIISCLTFVLGAWIGYKKYDLKKVCINTRFCIFLCMITFVFCVLNALDMLSPELQRLLRISGVMTVFCVAFHCVKHGAKIHPMASASVFFVYCIHLLQPASDCTIAQLSTYLIRHSIGLIPYVGAVISYLFAPCLTFCMCMFLFKIMTKFFPKFTSVITGSRIS